MENRVEKTVGAVKERSLSLAHSLSGRRRFNDEDAILDGWLHRETSVQGDGHPMAFHVLKHCHSLVQYLTWLTVFIVSLMLILQDW